MRASDIKVVKEFVEEAAFFFNGESIGDICDGPQLVNYIEDFEDGNLDEAIKKSILSSITQTVMKKVDEQVNAKLDNIIIKAAEKGEKGNPDKYRDYLISRPSYNLLNT